MNIILKTAIDKLTSSEPLDKEEFVTLLIHNSIELRTLLATYANKMRQQYFNNHIYIRGLIEFSNYCKNDCFYCGIRHSNRNLIRYRLTKEEILSCCKSGYKLGFRTFVLQSGEDAYYTDERMTDIVSSIHERYPDCAITLSVGERSRECYQQLFQAGASRYLLRHETSNLSHYESLHPATMSYQNRMQCLNDLKEIGYQTGCGFMVGSPFQTPEHIAEDLLFIQNFKPEMVGIGPFIPHRETPFRNQPTGSIDDTLLLLSILRLIQPTLLLPATTALGTLDAHGRTKGILAGANVIMPNLSPVNIREHYCIYDNKACTGKEAADSIQEISKQMLTIEYQIVTDRGDSPVAHL